MGDIPTGQKRRKRSRKALDPVKLEELALAYVARFATTGAKLENYLARKLRERGFAPEDSDGDDPELALERGRTAVSDIVERFVAAKYVDDESYARMRSGAMLNKGYGKRRIDMALRQAGVAEDVREEVGPSEAKSRHAALALAKKRGLGPFARGSAGIEDIDDSYEANQQRRALREKQLAAMVRAGHAFEAARALIEAETREAAEEWAEEHDADDDG